MNNDVQAHYHTFLAESYSWINGEPEEQVRKTRNFSLPMPSVQDIIYFRERGIWERTAGKYTKIHIGPETPTRMMTGAGFGIEYFAVDNGMITPLAGEDV